MAASVSIMSSSSPPWISSSSSCSSRVSTIASLSFSTTRRNLSMNAAAASSSALRSGFLQSSSPFSSSFPGLPLGLGIGNLNSGKGTRRSGGGRLVVRAGKAALCLTKRNRSRKSLARTHGFRRRMKTTSGRAILKRRRAKGRWVLCTKTNSNSGKGS